MTFWKWSRTASANANSDATSPWPEGMPPSQINDSARAMMAAAAKYRDDLSGVIATSGTATAYTVASYQVFDTLAHLDGKVIAFTPHVMNDAAPTLNVDGLGAKPLRAAHGVDLQSNVLLSGTPYVALYNNANAEFVLQGFSANPYGIPLAAGMDYWADTTPGSAYAFPRGQAISRTTYATLFNLIGTRFGSGDGTTTFNLPPKSGRASVMVEETATLLTSAYFGGDSTVIGATGGAEKHTLTQAELPAIKPTGTITNGAITSTATVNGSPAKGGNQTYVVNSDGAGGWNSFTGDPNNNITVSSSQAASTFTGNNLGSGDAHATVPPTIVCNYIMRVI